MDQNVQVETSQVSSNVVQTVVTLKPARSFSRPYVLQSSDGRREVTRAKSLPEVPVGSMVYGPFRTRAAADFMVGNPAILSVAEAERLVKRERRDRLGSHGRPRT